MSLERIAIVGTVGIPGNYGGFETLAQNLTDFYESITKNGVLTVYCSSKAFIEQPDYYGRTRLYYIRLDANGVQSIIYDVVCLLHAIRGGNHRILLLGVSGALFLPLVRLFARARIVTNIDGLEWKREKWNWFAKVFLRASEWAAVRFSHQVIADNQSIAEYVTETYRVPCNVIAYGGDHAVAARPDELATKDLPSEYALALCRIEPENNVEMILKAFTELDTRLVFVGNWDNSEYGRYLKSNYSTHPNIIICNPTYGRRALRAIRGQASIYIHGHSAGGTNPSLVEMMHFGIPVLAHGCSFNRNSTEGKARYFQSSTELAEQLRSLSSVDADQIGSDMLEIAQREYTWEKIGKAYFELLDRA